MTNHDPWLSRLHNEYLLVKEYCANSTCVSYSASPLKKGLPPDRYLIKYAVKSIVEIDDQEIPVYGYEHLVLINLPHNYPMVSGPECKMASNIWHPNIRHNGSHKGRICINSKAMGAWLTLDMLIQHIGEMLQYKNYHAENIQPYPEDTIVARWVREIGEPNGFMNLRLGITVDNRPLQKPSINWSSTRKKKIFIKPKSSQFIAH